MIIFMMWLVYGLLALITQTWVMLGFWVILTAFIVLEERRDDHR